MCPRNAKVLKALTLFSLEMDTSGNCKCQLFKFALDGKDPKDTSFYKYFVPCGALNQLLVTRMEKGFCVRCKRQHPQLLAEMLVVILAKTRKWGYAANLRLSPTSLMLDSKPEKEYMYIDPNISSLYNCSTARSFCSSPSVPPSHPFAGITGQAFLYLCSDWSP